MFEPLRTAREDVATAVAYRVGLRIYERERFPTWRNWLATRPDDRMSDEAVRISTHILEQIEARTGKPLSTISDQEMSPFLREMYDVMEQRWRANRKGDPAVAQRILEEMRRDYGGYRAVA
ncbi:MAG TPA: hypothetical protein VFT45_02765 [Longimicrobium sp.]|nr:hypothetical protein [Longimicrobium sp.]